MIESYYWRAELRREVAWLRVHQRFRRWTEKQQVLFERRLMLVAFQIRVLLERPKVSARVRKALVPARVCLKVGTKPVTVLNSVAIEEHFDLEHPRAVELSVRDLCNQLIHHYVLFAFRGKAQSFEHLVVFSDYKRNVCLYELKISDVIDAFSVFASESSAAYSDAGTRFVWSQKRKDYVWEEEPDAGRAKAAPP